MCQDYELEKAWERLMDTIGEETDVGLSRWCGVDEI
jgi:hypothetical protein